LQWPLGASPQRLLLTRQLKTIAKYEKVDANKVKFVLPLKPREKQQFNYEVTTQHESNVTR
jgi:hypothetical protein